MDRTRQVKMKTHRTHLNTELSNATSGSSTASATPTPEPVPFVSSATVADFLQISNVAIMLTINNQSDDSTRWVPGHRLLVNYHQSSIKDEPEIRGSPSSKAKYVCSWVTSSLDHIINLLHLWRFSCWKTLGFP